MKPAYIVAMLATVLPASASYLPKRQNDKKPEKPVVHLSYHIVPGEPITEAQDTRAPTVSAPSAPAPTAVKSEEDKSDPNSEFWRNMYDQRLRVIIDAKIYVPLTMKMDWSSLSYRDKAEKLFEQVAFGGGAPPEEERDMDATLEPTEEQR